MSVTFTEEQKKAIASRGKVLVSASAGSGKTAVMIERLVTLIVEEGVKLDQVIAVTFTNKAAAQMKEKLRKALIKKISDPAADANLKGRLKDQLYALPLADISTFHSFCARLVRTYFYLVGEQKDEETPEDEGFAIDPAFRILSSDGTEGEEIAARALDETFERLYETNGEDFRALLQAYFYKKKDDKLRTLVGDLHGYARSKTDYRAKLNGMGGDEFEGIAAFLLGHYQTRAKEYQAIAAELSEVLKGNPRAGKLLDGIKNSLDKILREKDFFEMCRKEVEKLPATPPSTNADLISGPALLRLKRLSKGVKELFAEINGFSSREAERARYLDGQKRAAALAALVLEYDKTYCRMMREAGALDYNDLEQYALELLGKEQVKSALREKYKYLFVDEYQDVNDVQETLIARLNELGIEEIFLVGDRKQAIYGFRGSKSEYFSKKEKDPRYSSLVLTTNFRSGGAVLDEVNGIFQKVMTEESCSISYSRAPMSASERYFGHHGRVIYHRVEAQKEEKNPPQGVYSVESALPRKSKTDAQAERIAEAVSREYGSLFFDVDKEGGAGERPVRYEDIAILVRKDTADAEHIVAALSARGIPVSTGGRVNLYDFFEARLIVDWLSYLDNAEQDIPFAAAMLSSVGAFTMEELSEIRLRVPAAYTFRDAVRCYGRCKEERDEKLSAKIEAFLAESEKLRLQAKTDTARSVIATLLALGLEREIVACGNGKERLYRVQRLLSDAEGSVNDFLSRLKRTGYRTEYAAGSGGDAVKVITMHASKGLEYPVVMLASLDKDFRGRDRDEVLASDGFGGTNETLVFAPKSYDAEGGLVYETILRRAVKAHAERETVKQELNLLYVAMTRAKYRLHLFFGKEGEALSPLYATRFSDFFPPDCLTGSEETAGEWGKGPVEGGGKGTRAEALSSLAFEYAYAGGDKLPVKSSATALIKAEAEDERLFERIESTEKTSAEKGTAYHKFLEHVVFGASAEEELSRMREEGILTESEVALLDGERLRKISEIPEIRALEGKRIRREQPFLLGLPADTFEKTDLTDMILYQGVIDLYGADERGYFIYDYKFSTHSDEYLKEHYGKQILLYKKAVAKITGIAEEGIRAYLINLLSCKAIEL